MSNKSLAAVIAAFLMITSVGVYAESDQPLSCESGTIVAFFNGIDNTREEAEESLKFLQKFYGDYSPSGERLRYEVMYNETEGELTDIVEVHEQIAKERVRITVNDRLRELDYVYEQLLFEMKSGGGILYDKYAAVDPELKEELDTIKDILQEKQRLLGELKLFNMLDNNSITDRNYADHQGKIDMWLTEGNKLLFVAHSQGNLFAVHAYDYAMDKFNTYNSIKVVHVAPPATILRSVNYTRADKDLVIGYLETRDVQSLPPPADTDVIPLFSGRPAGLNGETDWKGHGFVEIYINPSLEISNRVRRHINISLESLLPPDWFEPSSFFSATLSWAGGWTYVDMFITEPNGKQVDFYNTQGDARYYTGNYSSPEHYYAYCDANKALEGYYKFTLTNADRALALLTFLSHDNGILAQIEVDFWFYPLQTFYIIVTRDENGTYRISALN